MGQTESEEETDTNYLGIMASLHALSAEMKTMRDEKSTPQGEEARNRGDYYKVSKPNTNGSQVRCFWSDRTGHVQADCEIRMIIAKMISWTQPQRYTNAQRGRGYSNNFARRGYDANRRGGGARFVPQSARPRMTAGQPLN